eukprot:TRINITY_DN17466_c0_g1_i1.p1 TRINITY_DN17466_c0_g1~~TRINITY_DN17466_c0_g1_i1.p1  ORF type:complete len:309 (+),score=59.31 TRINITY_DN17466_c0_g1_i1:65-991(+)
MAAAAESPSSPVSTTDVDLPPTTPQRSAAQRSALKLASLGLDSCELDPERLKRGLSAIAALLPTVVAPLPPAARGPSPEPLRPQPVRLVLRRLTGKQRPPAAYLQEPLKKPPGRVAPKALPATLRSPTTPKKVAAPADKKAQRRGGVTLPESRAVKPGIVHAEGSEQKPVKPAKKTAEATKTTAQPFLPALLVTARPRREPQPPETAATSPRPLAARIGKGGAKRVTKVIRDASSGITKADIRRLARRAGCQRMQATITEEARVALRGFLKKVLGDVIPYTEAAQRKTTSAMDVVHGLRRQGCTVYGG